VSKAIFYIGPNGDASTELANRTANLIEWNMVNYQKMVKCDESAMMEAMGEAGRFKLAEMKTDFSITTTAEMRMLFLSMPFAFTFADGRGIAVPTALPVSMTDHRGY
jgi:hypothetical protein